MAPRNTSDFSDEELEGLLENSEHFEEPLEVPLPNDPDSELTAEQPFHTMKLLDLIAEYSFARAKSND